MKKVHQQGVAMQNHQQTTIEISSLSVKMRHLVGKHARDIMKNCK